ncbi:AraC family transcriptional regulator [Nevskia sp.]|uniref:AraC family transcriptional regulator n=1 Tax=Nevskia sp. TaxID=1929292 RepID=UPI0025E4A341|nr:AraC family transcriptional regulator [Nevskia sp.]
MKYLVRSGGLQGFPELVEELGQRPLDLLEEVGLAPGVLRDPDLYIPYPALADLLTLAARRCRAPDFGVRLGSRQGLEVVGALGNWLCLQARVGDALTLLQKNLGFHARGIEVDVDAGRQRISLAMRLAFAQQTDCAQLLALSMALLARSISQLHGTGLKPDRVELDLPAPHDPRSWSRAFAVTPTFGASSNQLFYPASLFELPVHIDTAVRERLSAQWRGGWRQAPLSLERQVERAIVALLPTGDCSLERVAHLVELKPRTLQAQLQRQQLGFGLLLRQARERLACEHLDGSDIGLTSLAMNLGFGDLAVFSRTFKSWTGLSPRAWRRRGSNRKASH